MDSRQQARLVEVNEQLVLAVLQAHAQRALDEKKIREITQLAEFDALTHLPNRLILLDRLGHAIDNAKRGKEQLAVLFIDLDKFKQINDCLGHSVGDQMLKTAAHCMTSSVRESDTVSRLGGDEFVILLEKVAEISDITSVIDKIFAALAAHNRIGQHTVSLSASVGISLYPDDGNDAETLLERADSAMYCAKRSGTLKSVFASAIEASGTETKHVPPKSTLERDEHRRWNRRAADQQSTSATSAAQELQADAQQALRRQTEFMATLAHELRNPLSPIRNAASLIQRAPPDPATAAMIHGVLDRQVTHMSKLLDDVFDMSRIATGKMSLEPERVNIVEILKQALETVQVSIDARHQKLDWILPDFPMEMIGDPTRLIQIFGNLLDNASKYTPENGLIVLTLNQDETAVVIKITDTGIGITAEVLPTIFELFVQDTAAVHFNGRGLGIGLALVKDLVEAHHGVAAVHSDGTGHGSQFTVTLPKGAFTIAVPVQ